MANPKIRAKRSSVEGKVPAATQLERGEFAVNTYDGKVYVVKDQFSVGIATTTVTVNPWDEPNGVGAGVSYSSDVNILGGVNAGSLNVSGISTFGNNVRIEGTSEEETTLTLKHTGVVNNVSAINFEANAGGTTTSRILFDWFGSEYSSSHGLNYVSGRAGFANHFFRNDEGNIQLSIRDNGNVSIGDHTPTSKLDVSGDVKVTGVITATSFSGDGSGLTGIAGITTFSGNYNHLFNKPTIPTNNNQLTNGQGFITGYTVTESDVTGHQAALSITESQISDLGTYATVATVAGIDTSGFIGAGSTFSGNYNHLSNRPTIPSNNNQLTNGAGYVTSNTQLSNEQVQDIVGGMVSSNTESGITVTYEDSDGTLDFSVASQTDNNFTTTLKSKLDGIAASATNVTNNNQITNGAGYATESYVSTQVSNLVDSAPGTLDTLNELAAALGDDANFSTTISNTIGTKMPLAGGTFTGDVTFNDDIKLYFGTDQDAKIYADTSQNLAIQNIGTTYLRGSTVILGANGGAGGFETAIRITEVSSETSQVELYYDNSLRLETVSGGVDVTGNITVSGTVDGVDVAALSSTVAGIDTSGFPSGSIPTNNNQLTNGAGYITSADGGNADTLDSLDSLQFLRSDTADQKTTGDLRFNNNIGITFGGSDNSRLFHDGDDLSLDLTAYVTDFKIRDGTTERYTFTKSGTLTATAFVGDGSNLTGISAGAGGDTGLDLNDDAKIRLGTGNDLEIYHDGTNSYIVDSGTGHLAIRAESLVAIQDTSGNNSAIFNDGSSVQLYWNGEQKFVTTAGGVTVTGTVAATAFSGDGSALTGISASNADTVDSLHASSFLRSDAADTKTSGDLSFSDSVKIKMGTGDDFEIYHNGTNTYLDNNIGNIFIRNNVDADVSGDIHIQAKSGENSIICYDDSTVELYYDNSKKFETTNTGVDVTGEIVCDSLQINDDGSGSPLLQLRADDGSPWALTIGNDSYSTSDRGLSFYQSNDGDAYMRLRGDGEYRSLNIQTNDGSTSNVAIAINTSRGVELRHQNSKKFETTSTGIDVTGNIIATGDIFIGNSTDRTSVLTPTANNLQIAGGVVFEPGSGNDVELYNYRTTAIKMGIGGVEKFRISSDGNIIATGDITSQSDISLKDNVVTYENALDKVLAMRGVEYDRNDMEGKHEVGLIAQEVEKIIPEVVGESNGLKNIAYGKLTSVLIEAIKEQQQQINDLRQQLNKGK